MKITKVSNYQLHSTKNNQAKNLSFDGIKNLNSLEKGFKNNLRIVFADVDGTLSASDDFITKRTLDAIEYLHEKNVPIVLTTARCYSDTLPIINQFSHSPNYTIALQGGELVNKNSESIYTNSISKRVGKSLTKWFKSIRANDRQSHLIMYFDDQPYSVSKFQFPWKSNVPVERVKSFEDLFEQNKRLQKAAIFKLNVAADPEYSQLDVIESFESARVPDLALKPSGSAMLEFQNKWVTKDKAINFLLKVLRIDPKNAMVIGDSANDIEMFDFIRSKNGLALAMGNAKDFVKAHANAVVDDVNSDGFAEAVSYLF